MEENYKKGNPAHLSRQSMHQISQKYQEDLLSKKTYHNNNMSLFGSYRDIVSADHLPALMTGLQISLQEICEPKNKALRDKSKNYLMNPKFFQYKAKQLLSEYKSGNIILTLSNRLFMSDFKQKNSKRHCKKVKTVKFVERIQVCEYNTDACQPILSALPAEEFLIIACASFTEIQYRQKI